jgi:methionyl-tRNA synthetase
MTDRILITSALPYVNGVKHLGNLVGSLLPADIHARFRRQRGDQVLAICGTDDHGTPAEIAAQAASIPVSEFVRAQSDRQADIYRRFNLAFDRFGGTSATGTRAITLEFHDALTKAGAIEERVSLQAWSDTDGRFLADRYVIGTCPACGSDKARGDQCEACGKLLDPSDLINPRSAISGAADIRFRETKHLYLKQSAYVDAIRAWVQSKSDWPHVVRSIALSWLNEGLQDRCITRDLSWGIPVPRPGFEGKVFYVWFDAPLGYIGITKDWADEDPANRDWRSWWTDQDVRYVQFLAKDNVPFHTVSFPCSVIASGLPYRLVDTIKGFNWLTYNGGKFSTSEQRGIFTDKALNEFPADYWRWWLTANAPEAADSDFSFQCFAEGCNADLSDNFGNLASRVLSFAASRFGTAPTPTALSRAIAERLLPFVVDVEAKALALESRKTADAIRALWTEANKVVVETAPWAALKVSQDEGASAVSACLTALKAATLASWAVIPQTSETVLGCLGEANERPAWPRTAEDLLVPEDRALAKPQVLFPKIDASRVADLEARYG